MRASLTALALAGSLLLVPAPAGASPLTLPGLPGTPVPAPPAVVPPAVLPVPPLTTLAGLLLWATTLETPHAELLLAGGARYALAPAPGTGLALQALAGRQVRVTGYPAPGPSVLQMPLFLVLSATALTDAPPPEVSQPPVVIQPLPPSEVQPPADAPASPADRVVRIQPVPFHGTALAVLYGQVAAQATAGVWLVGGVPVADPSGQLGAHVGQRVAVVARPAGPGFAMVQVWPLQQDWAGLLPADGAAALYSEPGAPIRVAVRGRILELDSAPLLGNQRTLVPLRAIAEALGAEVTWDPATQTVTVQAEGERLVLQVGTARITLYLAGAGDARTIDLDVAPILCRGRVLVPVRALSEALGWRVDYAAATRTVHIQR